MKLVNRILNEDILNRSFVDSRLFYCLSCHHYEKTNNSYIACSFVGILGKKVDSDKGYDYSNLIVKYVNNSEIFASGIYKKSIKNIIQSIKYAEK